MSYRTFKRVLGETSLERKCRWWFGISLAVMLLLSFTWYLRQTNQIVVQGNRELGKELVRSGLLEKHMEHLGELETPGEKPASGANGLVSQYDQDFYRKFNQSIRDMRLGRDFQWTALYPDGESSDGVETDEYERQLLAAWQEQILNHDPGASELTPPPDIDPDRDSKNANGQREYVFYHPILAEQFCINCHQTVVPAHWRNLKEGDLVALARVNIDDQRTANAQAKIQAFAWVQAVVIGALSMFSLWAIIRYVIVKPLSHLRDVSNAVREGDTDKRAQIRTGDEFEELAAAFNRMLRQLLSQQNELENVNEELDTRLDELAQANMRLFEMNRVKSDFLATVSHELRTPLNSIIGFSDVLMTIDKLDAKQRRYATNIQRSGRILLDMIDDILDLAKMESGRMDVKPSEFSVAGVISAQCDMARPLTEKKNIDLECTAEKNLPPMLQDQAKVQQIINNLLSNAIKFTPEGGRITVRATKSPEGDLLLTVTDTGVGISEEDQAVVFEKFRQGTSAVPGADAMTREHSGTGLGLSIVRELCRLMGGEVTLESALGRGSKFTVQIPWRLEVSTPLDSALKDDLQTLAAAATPHRQADLPPTPAMTQN